MRKRYLLLIVTALFGLMFMAVDRYTQDITASLTEQKVREADYYGETLISRRYDTDGSLADTFYAATSAHYPEGDLTVFSQPRLLVSTDKSWVLTANEGVLQGNQQALNLSGDILIRPQDVSDDWQLETSAMTYHIDRQLAESDQPVLITSDHTRMSGTGMLFDTQRQRLELHSKVSTHYAPE